MRRLAIILLSLLTIQFSSRSEAQTKVQPFSLQIKAVKNVIRPQQSLSLQITLRKLCTGG